MNMTQQTPGPVAYVLTAQTIGGRGRTQATARIVYPSENACCVARAVRDFQALGYSGASTRDVKSEAYANTLKGYRGLGHACKTYDAATAKETGATQQ